MNHDRSTPGGAICHTDVLPLSHGAIRSLRRAFVPLFARSHNPSSQATGVRSFAEVRMTSRPVTIGSFEFVVVSSLRAAQLMRGCTPRVATSIKHIVTAQREVAAGSVARLPPDPAIARKHGL
jgi:DNA-directed RNA polymerase subunit K/omega